MAGTMKTVNFIFAVHFHQPVGRSEKTIKDAYFKSYLPFIEAFEKSPHVKLVIHYSGTLYEWFTENHPEFLEKLKVLVRRGQVEILSGGFYDPIFPLIPYDSSVRQIQLQTEFIKKNFLRVPQGAWLTEYIWEPHLPKVLADAGIEYTVVDGSIEGDGYFVTDV